MPIPMRGVNCKMRVLRTMYEARLRDDILPYWRRHEDYVFGGVCNCLDNSGGTRLSDDKFSWSQGRYLWVLSRQCALQEAGVNLGRDPVDLRSAMDKTFGFLVDRVLSAEYRCHTVLSRSGNRKKSGEENIYTDCYVLSGLSEYVRVTNSHEKIPLLDAVYRSIFDRVMHNAVRTDPYAIPAGYRVHDFFMTMVNTVADYIAMRRYFGLDAGEATAFTGANIDAILDDLWRDGCVREYVSGDAQYHPRLLDRHLAPGHMLESMWFCAEFLNQTSRDALEQRLGRILQTVRSAFDLGWDAECGGLLRFVDRDGGKPHGQLIGDSFEEQIRGGWDGKLWWVHAEALFSLLYMYSLTGDQTLLERNERLADYVFSTFPSPNTGEWIQVRRRDGSPDERIVALPVKDPFHVARSFCKIIALP